MALLNQATTGYSKQIGFAERIYQVLLENTATSFLLSWRLSVWSHSEHSLNQITHIVTTQKQKDLI
jgi:hypothetical protein